MSSVVVCACKRSLRILSQSILHCITESSVCTYVSADRQKEKQYTDTIDRDRPTECAML